MEPMIALSVLSSICNIVKLIKPFQEKIFPFFFLRKKYKMVFIERVKIIPENL